MRKILLVASAIAIILVTIITWEGNLQIDHRLNLKCPWVADTRKRLLLQLRVSPLYTIQPLKQKTNFKQSHVNQLNSTY